MWSRPIAIVATLLAVILITGRFRALEAGASSSYDQGRILGQLVVGPVVIGMVIWGGIVLWRRRREPAERFLTVGLLTAVASVAILASLASVRS